MDFNMDPKKLDQLSVYPSQAGMCEINFAVTPGA